MILSQDRKIISYAMIIIGEGPLAAHVHGGTGDGFGVPKWNT
jgi:hypothetical protein